MADSLFSRLSAIHSIVGGTTVEDVPQFEDNTLETVDVPTKAVAPPDGLDLGGNFDRDRVGDVGASLAQKYGLTLTSHYRDPAHNTAVGGAPRSDHLTGMAVDLSGKEAQMEALYRWAKPLEGTVFRKVIYKYEDPGDHSDHVHLSFLGTSTMAAEGGAEAIGKTQTTSSGDHEMKQMDLLSRVQSIGQIVGGKDPRQVNRQRTAGGFQDFTGAMAANFARARSGRAPTATSTATGSSGTKGEYQSYAFSQFANYGWGAGEQAALIELVTKESGWNPNARNPGSGAAGLFQKMPMHGAVESSWQGQIQWGLDYIARRYGTPSKALAHWLARVPINGRDVGNWY